jgi:hypothetical protein
MPDRSQREAAVCLRVCHREIAEQVACSPQYVGKVARKLSTEANEQATESALALRAECLETLDAALARYLPLALGAKRDDAAMAMTLRIIATKRQFMPVTLIAELSRPAAETRAAGASPGGVG